MKTCRLIFLLFFIFCNLRAQDSLQTRTDSIIASIPEVIIKAQRNAVKMKGDKTLLDLQNSSVFGTKLIDALPVVPGIQIDRINKSLTFENKNVQLFVDGRQIMIPSESIYSYIQSIPTTTIKQVEFNSHPGAKYDAGSQCAIISITTKKSQENHINFNPYFNYTKYKYYNNDYGASLFGKLKKIDFAVSYDDYFEKIFSDKVSNDVYYKDGNVDYSRNDVSNEIATGRYQNINGTIGYKTQRNDFVVSYLRTAADPIKSNAFQTTNFIQNNNEIQEFETEKEGQQTNNSDSYTAVYNHRLDTLGMALQLFYDHTDIKYRNNVNQTYTGFEKDSANLQQIGTDTKLNTFKIDFNNREDAKYNLEVGFKYSWTENGFHNYLSSLNDYSFNVDEKILGSYFTIKREWESFNATIGIRGENNSLKGNYYNNLNDEVKSANTDNFRIFPNIFIEYLWKKNSIAFIADSKIQRPSYAQYNPLEIINDPYSVSHGNPALISASVYNYSLKYIFNKRFSFSTFFTNVNNQVGDIVVSNTDNISVTEPVNLDYSRYYGINTGGSFNLLTWWSISYWGQISNLNKKGTLPDRIIRTSVKGSYYSSIYQTFKLPKDFMINLNAFISGNGCWGGIYNQDNAWGEVSLSGKKEFFNKKLSVEIFANDIFNTNSELSAHYQDSFYSTKFTNHYAGRCFGFGISFNFNKEVEKVEMDTDTEEKNRTN